MPPATTAPRGLHWDSAIDAGLAVQVLRLRGAATEVEVDGFTGAYRTRRVDIVHDVGDSLSPLVDIGQIEGGFVQGAGWLTLEDLRWDESDGPDRGRLTTQAASTYKLPSFSEMPEVFNVTLLEHAHEEGAVYGSKAVGEPPLMLAFSVREALRQAAAAFGPAGTSVDLASPATPEAVCWALEQARAGHEHGHVDDGLDGAVPPAARRGSTVPAGVRASPRTRSAMPDRHWIESRRAACARRGEPGVLVTLAERASGHAPRAAGAKMVVGAADTWGSIGGGNLEAVADRSGAGAARDCRRSRSCATVALSDKAPYQHGVQCCGGEVTVLLDPLPVVPAVAIFGVGHVGLELARILARHDIELHLIDSRPEQLSRRATGGARRRDGPGARAPCAGAARARARRVASPAPTC